MNTAFLKLFDMSIKASWLILAVILLRFALKRAPKWSICTLWAIVALRLICPFSIESSLSLVPRSVPGVSEPVLSSTPQVITVPSAPLASEQIPTRAFSLGALWALGFAVMLVYALIGLLRLRHSVREAVPIGGIWLCDDVSYPFILGIVKPRIYLSSSLEGSQLQYVLAHERAHLSRKDHWWKPLSYTLLSVYWFNPLVWAAYILFCRDIELACDERVIRSLNMSERKAYSHALLACSLQRKIILACPLAFGEVGVKERVKSVLTYKKPKLWMIIAAGAACVIAAVCFLTVPKSSAVLSQGPAATISEELMAEYAAFGISDKNGVIYYNGERVRFFLDGYESGDCIIARFQSYDELGTVDVHTVRDDTVNADGSTTLFGAITDIVPYSQEEFDEREYIPSSTDSTVSEGGGFLAQRQSQWQEALTPYAPFGVTYGYDAASDDYKIYYNGAEVRGIYDEERQLWITEHAGNGTYSEDAVDLYAVYENGTITGVREATAQEQETWTALREATYAEASEQNLGGRTIAEILGDYSVYGLTYEIVSGVQGNIYFNGVLAESFWDEKPDGSIFTTQSVDKGGIRVRTVYDENGKLTGLAAIETEE